MVVVTPWGKNKCCYKRLFPPHSWFIQNELNLRTRIKIKIEEKMISFDV